MGKKTKNRVISAAVVAGVAVLAVGGVTFWPGSQVRPAIGALTTNFGCFVPQGEAKTAALGDSITAGHSFPLFNVGGNDSYADLLACETSTPISNLGVPGSTSAEMLPRVDVALASHPTRMLVLAGTNDVYLLHDPNVTVKNLETIRAKLAAANVEGVFGLLPPSNHDPEMVEQVNAKIKTWATSKHVTLVDYLDTPCQP